jgi:TonB-dependent starch-binding outer membrane protein SusC
LLSSGLGLLRLNLYQLILSKPTLIQMTKNFTNHLLMLIGWFLLNATNLHAQESINVSGTVISTDAGPLPGISILEKGTNNGTLTDLNGNFSLTVSNANAVIRFSFLGYRTQEIRLNNRTELNLTMEEEEMGLDEVLVIGYGTLRRSDLTGSVSRVSSEEINAFPTSNILQAMTGRTSGVQVIQNTGAPGSPVSVRVRGTNSIQGGNEPLYVIDGFPFSGNPTNLNNADIASIEVLKDASATAIYGSRGANGVVLITTKRGRAGQTLVEIEGSYGIQQLRKKLDLMNGSEYARLQNLQAINDNQTPYFSEADITGFGEGFDWQDLVFRQAALKTGSVNITGGTDRTNYALSGSYLGQEGIIQGSDYNRYSLRFNLDHELSDRIKVEFSNILTKLVTDRRDSGGGTRGNSLIGSAIAAPPISNPFNPDGSYTVLGNQFPFMAPDIINPLNFINEQRNTIRANVTLANLAFVYNPIPEITVRISGGIENRDDRTDNYTTRNFFNSAGVASVTTGQFTSLLNENTITYNKTFADRHQLSVLTGFTYQDFQTTFLAANGTGFLSDVFQTGNLGAAATPGVPSSGYAKSVLLSYLGRVNYSFDNRYLFTFSFRSDGSSRYSPGSQWGYFPSGAVAWRISEESFMQNTVGISDLKLRGSWGLTGNQAIQPYATLNQLFPGNTVFNNELYTTFAPGSVLPGDLRWESTEQLNIGFDVGLFNNRVFFTADYYIKNTRDLLNTVRLPSSTGFLTTIQNVGNVQNKGLELNLDAVPFTGEFSWNINANISFNRNRVIALNNGEDILGAFVNVLVVADNVTLLREGRPIGQFWGFVEDGYDEQGRIRFRDIDGDGTITENDKTYIGDPNPDFIFGFNSTMNYKNFELTAFFQGSYGNDIFNVSAIPSTMDFGQGMNMPRAVLNDHWTPQNPNAAFPVISRSNTVRISDRFVEDGSFVRLRNIQLGYNLPTANWGWQGVRSAQVFVSGQNLWTITGYSWWDPEVNSRGAGVQQGIDHYSYPIPKVFTLGFRAGF